MRMGEQHLDWQQRTAHDEEPGEGDLLTAAEIRGATALAALMADEPALTQSTPDETPATRDAGFWPEGATAGYTAAEIAAAHAALDAFHGTAEREARDATDDLAA